MWGDITKSMLKSEFEFIQAEYYFNEAGSRMLYLQAICVSTFGQQTLHIYVRAGSQKRIRMDDEEDDVRFFFNSIPHQTPVSCQRAQSARL
jgi:hypothetical protein